METSDQIGQAFRQVDQATDPQALVNHLSETSINSGGQPLAWERQVLVPLNPQPGARILDVGCGLGDDVRAIAEIVGSTGQVVGIDHSQVMIEEAWKRSRDTGLSVDFHVADAHKLEFSNDSFDGCRTKRTLHHVADPLKVITEMVRVAKPGAPVVASEPDWDTMIVNAENRRVTRLITEVKADSVLRNGWIGRQLPGLFHAAGLVDVGVTTIGFTFADFSRARMILDWDEPARLAQEQGKLGADEVAAWFAELQAAADQNRFFAALFGFVVWGHKPAAR